MLLNENSETREAVNFFQIASIRLET